jgi:ABC-2 type transport system permease protein
MSTWLPLAKSRFFIIRNKFYPLTRIKPVRISLLLSLAVIFIIGDFFFFRHIFLYLASVEEFSLFFILGLSERFLGMIFLASLSMLLFSNILVSLSVIYLSDDLYLLHSSPIKLNSIFGLKFNEALVNSSYMILIFSLPIFFAFGTVFSANIYYYLLIFPLIFIFILAPAGIGVSITVILMRFLPAKKTYRILTAVGLVFAAVLVVSIRLMKPERLLYPIDSDDFVRLLDSLSIPSFRYLPSSWAAKALVAASKTEYLIFLKYLLPLTIVSVGCVAVTFLLAKYLYFSGWSGAQESRDISFSKKRRRLERFFDFFFPVRASPQKALFIKDIKIFLRDTTQWSQLFLLVALIFIYLFNIKNIPLPNPYLKNFISFINLGLAGFVLAAVSARYSFTATSLEGKSFWIIHSSPINYAKFLWEKFFLFLLPLLIMALCLVYFSNLLLKVDNYFMILSLVTITVMTIALNGMGVGLGALFPRFEAENSAKIAVSSGGVLYMILSLLYIGIVIVLEARPVYLHFASKIYRGVDTLWESLVFYGILLVISVLVTLIPMQLGIRALKKIDL